MLSEVSIPNHHISELEILLFLLPRVGVALLVGTIVGVEREIRGKLAGIKTNALICAASAMFTALSLIMTDHSNADLNHSGQQLDATRIVAQIVSGIGFIGAGAIFKSSSKVQGLTTAAVIWTVSALGILAGYGIYLSTIVITVGLIVFLSFVAHFEKRYIRNRSQNQTDFTGKNSTMD
jgi:putative Mg2+ transporter-C (MgtC) family protein